MKYYIGKIEELNGELDYQTEYLFATDGNPDDYTKKTASEWRGSGKDNWDENQQGWWCMESLIFDDGYQEIPKKDFDVLKKYITVL
jgi:hypothetical protein